ncbi:hypothetical protein Poly51_24800 [Rubripirellula tenax]|uniref:Uncharacterized protein n=1 Tax=Rubripirellula tenax TaxID=2528015 RepID=A0A5C6F7W3_9BACT|nr:efflux RND transporter periplasmic adaptor subunit [Rubripirellula tenax]TWU56564.1 hypothetical protein Poly51_24800 [Rubripirellula tenax]
MEIRDPNTIDLAEQKVRLADDIRFWPVRERGQRVYRIEIPSLHRFFRIGHEEYVFVSLIDGDTTIAQACGLAASMLGKQALSLEQSTAIVRWLIANELARLPSQSHVTTRDFSPRRKTTEASSWARWNPFWIKVPIRHSERVLTWIASVLGPLASPAWVVSSILFIALAWVVLFTRWSEFVQTSSEVFSPSSWLWMLIVWVALKVIHEVAHAVACHRQGGEVGESGLVFVLFAPLAYVDVSSCWRMNSRRSRILVAAAGMYVEWVVAALAVMVWAFVSDSIQTRSMMSQIVVMAGVSTIVFNANVLMRFDGYFIFADLIDVPNLAMEGSESLARVANRLIWGERTVQGGLRGWRRGVVFVYGALAMVWRVVVCVSLSIVASSMFAGAGVVLAVIAVLLAILTPLKRWWNHAARWQRVDPIRCVRGCVIGSLLGITLLATVLVVPIPTSNFAAAVVRYRPETMIRTRSEGLVAKIHVRDGEDVRRGDIMIELENRDLVHRWSALKLTMEQNAIRIRQAIESRDDGARIILEQRNHSLADQVANFKTQVDALTIVASRSGRVVAPHLDERVGTHVKSGDLVAVIAGGDDKEVIAMVPQQMVDDVRPLIATHVSLIAADNQQIGATLDRIEPRASDQLADPALAATMGGPMAVHRDRFSDKDEDRNSARLLEPYFRARLGVDVGPTRSNESLAVGSRVWASFGYRDDTAYERLSLMIRSLWNQVTDNSQPN